MSAPGTVDLMLLLAAANGEITHDGGAKYGYRWNGADVDYDCSARLHYLCTDGYFDLLEAGPNRYAAVPTADGLAAIR